MHNLSSSMFSGYFLVQLITSPKNIVELIQNERGFNAQKV